jgi:hypothetical protein
MSHIKPRSASVVVYQGDDLERIAELRRKAETALRNAEEAKKRPRRGGDEIPSAQAEQDEYDAFVLEAAERATVIEINHLPRKVFRGLMAEHAPREGNDDDEPYGVNMETFAEVFLHKSIVAPEFDTRDECVAFLDDLSEGDFDKLFGAAYFLNRIPGADPKDFLYSVARRSSNET